MALGTHSSYFPPDRQGDRRADMVLAATTAIVGTSAAAAYLDAKFHFTKDLWFINRFKQTEKAYAKASMCHISMLDTEPVITFRR